ncbi:MAG: phosphoribosylformylglycinamidine synthase subunit PurL [Spirochaetota bacterium]
MEESLPFPVYDMSDMPDNQLSRLLESQAIGLTIQEARQLQQEILHRPPTLAELILFGIEGSEHCSYKSSRPYLKLFPTEGEHVILGAKEDAGVIRVAVDNTGRGYAAVMSHESHNHPSQLVPYEGAATGVGGNVRDVCCMGADVVAIADDLRFGSVDLPKNKWIYEGVVSGIAGYGNPIGVPNIGGGLQFDPGYNENCLVTVVTLGVMEEEGLVHSCAPPDSDGSDLILVGKPTDNSGFGGASFASFELQSEKHEQNKGAVQEPNAFLGRHLIKSSNELFKKLKDLRALGRVGFKDLGAGGIACASVELADEGGYGATVELERVHTADGEFPPHVILCSETQERYMWVSPPDLTPLILNHYNQEYALPEVSEKAAAVVIGHITQEPTFTVTSLGKKLVEAPAGEVTKGFLYHRPLGELPAALPQTAPTGGILPEEFQPLFLRILAHENVASRQPLWEQYDKQVQGRTHCEAGSGDTGIITPFNDASYPEEIREVGLTLTTDQNPRENRIDPYQGAINAVASAYCNTIAVGAAPMAISDCLCYGNPEKPEQMRLFAEGCKGVADAANLMNVPVIAGNVSLYNESDNSSIPPSPMIAILGRLERAEKAIPKDIPAEGAELYLIGERTKKLGGSILCEFTSLSCNEIPSPNLTELQKAAEVLALCSHRQLAAACHDISEGGLAVTVSEMLFAHACGCDVSLPADSPLPEEAFLFGESHGFVVAVFPTDREEFLTACRQYALRPHHIGTSTATDVIRMGHHISVPLQQAKDAWEQGLRRRLS